ncbi:hypothetical protein ACHAXR_013141 [Thalassiosira sp. AJA248-18]
MTPYAGGLLNPEVARSLIVGGVEAPEGRYSYTVSLKDGEGTHFCGGSLISTSVVLTAAHCVVFDDSFTVVIGRHNLTSTNVGDDVTIAEKVIHPNYDFRISDDYDVALVFLSRPTTADVDIVQINPDNSIPVADAGVTYLGWGEIDSDPSTLNVSETLREVETFVMTNEQCASSEGIVDGTTNIASYDGLITDNMLCTFDNMRDSCQKDSGGPLILRGNDAEGDIQVGVSSWGISCASNVFPGVAARVSSVYDWIKVTLCIKSNEPGSSVECNDAEIIEIEMPTNIFGGDADKTTPTEIETTATTITLEGDATGDTKLPVEVEMPDSTKALETDSPDPTNIVEGVATTNTTLIEVEMPDQTKTLEGDSTDSTETDLPDPTNMVEGDITNNTALIEVEMPDPTKTLEGDSTDGTALIEIQIEMPDSTNNFEGGRTRSAATNHQSTNAALTIIMLALANHMMCSI